MNHSLPGVLLRLLIMALLMYCQWYLYRRLINFLETRGGIDIRVNRAIQVLFLLNTVPLITIPILSIPLFRFPHILIKAFVYPFFIWQGATFFIFVAIGIGKMLRGLEKVFFNLFDYVSRGIRTGTIENTRSNISSYDATRRAFIQKGIIGISAYSFAGASYGVISKDEYDTISKKITIPNLPEEFKGFTIGMVSDIHSSVFMMKEEMDEYVKAVNNLKTDLIVVTGDFVNSQTEEVYPFAESFSQLRAPFGVYGCLGNHDYFADVDVVAKEVEGCGIHLLHNTSVPIAKETAFINLLGVDDIGYNAKPESYLASSLLSARNSQPKILLCHKPYFFDEIDKLGIDLTLSGHTHGGQIVFAKINNTYIAPASLFSRYVWGLYRKNKSQMYVNRGIGTVGVPFRINCPPEITKIILA